MSDTQGKDQTRQDDEARTAAEAEAIWKEMDAEESADAGDPPADEVPAEDEGDGSEPEGAGEAKGAGAPHADEQPKPQAQERTADPIDPRWNELPEWARTEYEKARNSERSHHGRYVAAQRQLDALRNQMHSRQPGETQQQADDRLEKVKAKIASLKDDYPEIADPLAEIIDTIGGTVNELKAAEQGRQQAAQQQYAAYVQEQTAQINRQHPDWLDVVTGNQAAFAQWLDDQPKRIRDAAQANWDQIVDAAGMAEVIGGFKQYIGIGRTAPASQPSPQQSRRDRQLAGSASPSRTSARPHASGLSPDADPQAAWDYWDKLDRQRNRA